MSIDDLYEDLERVKIRFIAAYERLVKMGLITEEQFEDVVDAIDRMDELSEEELKERLSLFQRVALQDKGE